MSIKLIISLFFSLLMLGLFINKNNELKHQRAWMEERVLASLSSTYFALESCYCEEAKKRLEVRIKNQISELDFWRKDIDHVFFHGQSKEELLKSIDKSIRVINQRIEENKNE